MVGALTLISLRQWRKHKLRVALTVIGIAIGVAVFFAVRTANLTLFNSLQNTVEKLAGKATLQISAGEAGFGEEFLKIVRETDGVKLAEPVVETIARTGSGENLLVLGLDSASDLEIHSPITNPEDVSVSDPLAFINRPDSIAVTRTFAERNKLKEGDSLELKTQTGKQNFIVRGFFKPAGAGRIFDGNLALLDIYSAQKIFGKGKKIDRIDIMTEADADVEIVKNALVQKMPAGLRVTRPKNRGQGFENAVSAIRIGMYMMSTLALTIGIFLIFNSFSISVNQRWKEIGILRALGIEGYGIQLMFLGEAVVLGIIGSTLGIAMGFFLAQIAVRLVSAAAATTFGLVTSGELPEFKVEYALTALLIGIAASIIAAWLPARAASRLDPILALHNIETRQKEALIGLPRILTGVFLILVGIGLTVFLDPRVGSTGQILYSVIFFLGVVIILPKLIALSAIVMRPGMNFFFGVEGVIAIDTMLRAPRRTSTTVGALMIGLSFVFANGALIQSQKFAINRSLDRISNADYLITTSDQVRSRAYHFSEETADRVASLKGVRRAENVRMANIYYREEEIAVIAHDIDAWLERATDALEEGDLATARLLGKRGDGFIVSENFSARFGFRMGDLITLETPSGSLSRPIIGVVQSYHSTTGTLFFDRKLYKEFWNDNLIDYILVNLRENADRSNFKNRVEAAIRGEQQAFIYNHEEFKGWAMRTVDQFFMLSYLQILIAVFIAVLGLVNTMFISVAERKHEIGVLRAIGTLRKQVHRMILLEAVSISLIGIAAGAVLGVLNSYFAIFITMRIITGFSLPFRFPMTMVLVSIPIVIFVSVVAAWIPARRAARVNTAEAISSE